MPTLCLNMIVKNESKILKKCFDSIVNYLDYWVICDTGSTDGTQEMIKKYFKAKNIKGELHQDKWVNFGHNRTLAIQKAYQKADYIILMDADFTMNIIDKNFKNKLLNTSYLIKYNGITDYRVIKIVKGNIKWKYLGVTHEYITTNSRNIKEKFDYITINHSGLGNNRSNKFKRDIKLLAQGIKDEPDNFRYHFYLANSYFDISDFENAMKYYKKRIDFNGWDEEVYLSMYKYALCSKYLKYPEDTIIFNFLKAFNYRPTRLEALYEVVRYYRIKEDYTSGYKYGILGYYSATNYPDDILFINKNIHTYKFIDELAICSFYVNDYKLSLDLNKNILQIYKTNKIDIDIKRIQKNLSFSNSI